MFENKGVKFVSFFLCGSSVGEINLNLIFNKLEESVFEKIINEDYTSQ